jgi:hypothetical protein
MTPTTAPAASAPISTLRFTAGALNRVEGPHFDQSLTPNANTQPFNLMEIPTGGWERNIFLMVNCTTAGNAAAVAFQPDAPWCALVEITFRDARGNTIVGPLTGFDLYLAVKWFGYVYNTDLAQQPTYLATTGAGATGGSFSFVLPLPLEIIGRDAIGALANGASNTALRINVSLAPSTNIYSTAPTALAAVRLRAYHEAWQQPARSAPNGFAYAQSPTGAGTFHQMTKTNYQYAASENRIALARKGNPIRAMAFVFRTAANARTATPALLGTVPFQLLYEGSDLLSFSEDLLRFRMWYTNVNLATGFDTGVLVLDWASDLDGKVGAELREQWLPTQPGSRIEARFTAGVAGNLDVITDEVVPQGDMVYVP